LNWVKFEASYFLFDWERVEYKIYHDKSDLSYSDDVSILCHKINKAVGEWESEE
jgi:hypothetical protein